MITEETQVLAFKYIVKDAETGFVYENTYGQKPLEIIVGRQQILPAMEQALVRIPVGSEQKIYLEKPYGSYDASAIVHIPRHQVGDIPLERGMTLYAKGSKGETLEVSVLSFDDQTVSIDHNHPMAGKNLIFKVKVVHQRMATPEELSHGHLHSEGDSCGCGSSCGCH